MVSLKMDMSLSKPRELVMDRAAWNAAVHCVAELDMTEGETRSGCTDLATPAGGTLSSVQLSVRCKMWFGTKSCEETVLFSFSTTDRKSFVGKCQLPTSRWSSPCAV